MFCPNCGKDCKNFKFYPDCGRDLQNIDSENQQETTSEQSFEKRREALEASGQAYCPKCLSTGISISGQSKGYRYPTIARSAAGAVIDFLGRMMQFTHESAYGDKCVCMNCGYEWYTKRIALQKKNEAHIAELLGEHSSCSFPGIDGSYMQIGDGRITISLSEKVGCIIPYDELAVVEHREGTGPLYGRLTVRDRAHCHRPIPKTLEAAKKDRFTILYDPYYCDSYRKICSALNAIIAENKKAGII